MARNRKILSPTCTELILPTYKALLELGGSGTNNEIYEQIIKDLQLSDEIVDESHLGSENQTELDSREIIEFTKNKSIRKQNIFKKKGNKKVNASDDAIDENIIGEYPEEIKPWRKQLSDVLQNMDPYGFERLAQRVLRECGFVQVEVTKKSGDGGIDGTGKLKINGIFSFNVAFQCKRYKGAVSAGDIRDFRGSLTTDIEKGVFITTGVFTKAAREEASNPGKQQIDLMDGEEFINKIAQYGIGVKKVITYEIDEEFFQKI